MKKAAMLSFFALQGLVSTFIGIAITERNINSRAHELTIISVAVVGIIICLWLWHRYKPDPTDSKGTLFYKKHPMLTGYIVVLAGVLVGVLLNTLWASGL